ncbi:hypothetical protein ACFQE5_01900 [Pseudonocardia hispaniensis]|uniref:Uncharacterized protein n=1 Tax=Pseudonocardia hispaniensis TaxID=904933 RepID=A0ABW1IWV6_9PSEU
MDAVVTAIIGAAPQLGGAGILLILFGMALRREAQDRTDYRTQLTAITERHAAELSRINQAHDDELAQLKADIKELRRQLAEVNAALDAERDRRRRAEDTAMYQRRPEDDPPWAG